MATLVTLICDQIKIAKNSIKLFQIIFLFKSYEVTTRLDQRKNIVK